MVWCAVWIPSFGPWCHFPRSPGVLSAASSWLRLSSGTALTKGTLPHPRLPVFLRDNCHLMSGQKWNKAQHPCLNMAIPAPDLLVGSSETPVATPSHTTSPSAQSSSPHSLTAWLSRTLTNEPSPCRLMFLNLFLRELSLRLTYIAYGLHSTFCSRWARERGGAKGDYAVMAPGRSLGGSLFINSQSKFAQKGSLKPVSFLLSTIFMGCE